MAAAACLGCAAIGLGPALALVLLTVPAEPVRVLVLVAGAFLWLLALLLGSLLWFLLLGLSEATTGTGTGTGTGTEARPARGLLLLSAAAAVLLQELGRFLGFQALKKANEGLVSISKDGRAPMALHRMAYVSGLSFGLISGIFSITNILAGSMGPGTVGIHGDSPYYFITSAFITMALVLLHIFWAIVFFDACERRSYRSLGLVVSSHLLTSGLTFLNPWYEASLIPIFILTLGMGLWAFVTAGGSFHNILKCLSCKQEEDSPVMMYSELQAPCEDREPHSQPLESPIAALLAPRWAQSQPFPNGI